MYCYSQMKQVAPPPQIGVSLAGQNVIKVSHKIKKFSEELCRKSSFMVIILLFSMYTFLYFLFFVI